ncbi:hypothetical protein EVAR_92250_1 [Eumeta japonica]|uniref:Uncharacterized protein n=1 Tax=Eumeta variegata TaxID=151549 RepID=A0A4C1TL73_EUMVA|nr:hypothetical protein EVAR_92250_1 [Eumeta japonica]
MTFLRGLKANFKHIFAARAYKSLAELKSAITNYKQVYEENQETTYGLPMEWGTKGNSPIHPASNKKIDVRPPERKLDATGPMKPPAISEYRQYVRKGCVKHLNLDLILGTDFMRQNVVVLDYNENVIVFGKKGLHALLVSHTPARTEQKLALPVMTYFMDWVGRNEKYLSACNLALISMPEKQWKVGDFDVNKELSVCQRDKL